MDIAGEYTFSELLKQFRVRERMSQQQLAEHLGVHRNTIGAWERGDWLPHDRPLVLELAQVLRLNPQDTDTLLQASVWQLSEILTWNVPYRRNPFFTGRQDVLKRLHDTLTSDKAAALTQAISGLGGVGKTQTAVEYAYRYTGDYKTILWARADSRETLVSDFVSIANLLKLPEKDEQDQSRVVNACKRWLNEHADWLLILDNAEDLALASNFIPARSKGHTLLTTREQVTGAMAQRIELATMKPEEGALFLLRRAQILATDAPPDNALHADWTRAREISQRMDGLPLALDQAGAYIEATECGLAGYLERYKQQHAKLLKLRGEAAHDHPEPVATTWSLSFERVQRASPAAADLLRLCAFLHPDAIPEEIITAGAPDLGPTLQPFATDLVELDSAISELRRYSLLRRDPETQTLGIHRLVQAVLKDGMDDDMQGQWAERTVRAVNRAFPDGHEFATWDRCQRYLSHVQVCAALMKQWNMTFPEAPRLLHEAGSYLSERVQYMQAEPLLQQALAIREQALGTEHRDVSESLNELAIAYKEQGRYDQAEPLYQRSLAILEKTGGPYDPYMAQALNNLALLYHEQGKYTQAEPLYQRALAIYEQAFGPAYIHAAISLNNLGLLYEKQGQYAKAESFHQRSLAIRKQLLSPEDPKLATSFNNLGLIYHKQGKYAQALTSYQQALAILEHALVQENPRRASSLNNLAEVYRDLGEYEQAEPLHLEALAICKQVLQPDHPLVATTLNKLARLYVQQGKYAQAEPLLQRALAIRERMLGLDHPDTATVLNDQATLYTRQGKYAQAELLYNEP